MIALRIPLLLTALAAVLSSHAQRKVIAGPIDAFTTDELGKIYVLHGDVIALYDATGHSWLRNSVKTFGRITNIDAYYSLKPMVFSQEQGQLAVLDNTLSIQGSVFNLPRNGFPQVVLVCMSVQNSFWFFDQQNQGLIRVDGQLRKQADTGRLDQLLGITPMPIAMQEFDSRLYLNDPKNGILVFDLFGTYVKTIPIIGAKSFEVRDRVVYYFQDGKAFVYDMISFAIEEIPISEDLRADALEVRIEHGHAYVRSADRIVIEPLPGER